MSRAQGMDQTDVLYVLRACARKYRERADVERPQRKFLLAMAEEIGRVANELEATL